MLQLVPVGELAASDHTEQDLLSDLMVSGKLQDGLWVEAEAEGPALRVLCVMQRTESFRLAVMHLKLNIVPREYGNMAGCIFAASPDNLHWLNPAALSEGKGHKMDDRTAFLNCTRLQRALTTAVLTKLLRAVKGPWSSPNHD